MLHGPPGATSTSAWVWLELFNNIYRRDLYLVVKFCETTTSWWLNLAADRGREAVEKDDMSWTDERVEKLKKLWSEGLSASQIARALGEVTRNAVIGKVHRLGLSGRATTSRIDRPRVHTIRRPPRPRLIVPEIELVEEARLANGDYATVMTVREGMCKWPIGDPSSDEFHFCGNQAGNSSPYCGAHSRMAYQPTQSRRDRRRVAG
jgi:GcrA cell cycle regulator